MKRPRSAGPAGRKERPARPAALAPDPRRPAPPRGDRPRHRAKTEEMFHGVRACEAIFARRPEAIVRVYLAESRRRQFAKLVAWCTGSRKGFQVVAEENLARLTGSIHHEGIAILARQVPRWTLAHLLGGAAGLGGPLVYLAGVQNLGSILRTAAHFGAGAILGRAGDLPPLSPAAVRVAEGAAETVPVCDLADVAADLGRLKREGWRVVVTSSHGGEPLFTAALPQRTVLGLGSEAEGVSRAVDALADLRVRISGTGAVESLNVSVACGVALGEIWRRHGG
jgi:TrmH RNA methyltransferase